MGKTALLLNPSSFSEFDKEQHRSQLTIAFEFCDTKAPAKLLPVLPKFFISILCTKIHPHTGCHGLLCTLRVMNAISIWERGGNPQPFLLSEPFTGWHHTLVPALCLSSDSCCSFLIAGGAKRIIARGFSACCPSARPG